MLCHAVVLTDNSWKVLNELFLHVTQFVAQENNNMITINVNYIIKTRVPNIINWDLCPTLTFTLYPGYLDETSRTDRPLRVVQWYQSQGYVPDCCSNPQSFGKQK